MSIECDLFNKSQKEYGSDYQSHLLEQYKIYVTSAERISQLRLNGNSFFLTINTALLVGFGGTLNRISQFSTVRWFVPIAMVGIILCYVWYRLVKSYRGLNSGKYAVINSIEKKLPISPYFAEWRYVGEGKNTKEYKPFSEIETWVPWTFVALYIILILVIACVL